MTSADIREKVGTYIRDLFVDQKINFDEAQELSTVVLELLPDNLKQDDLLPAIKKLDDNYQILSPLVMKLLGEWVEGING
jgi:hypothetical protein